MGFVDEFTGSKAVTSLGGTLIGGVRDVAKSYGGDVGGALVDEVGGRIGLGVSNAGPDAVASLSASGRTGSPSPDLGSPHNAGGGFDLMATLRAYWKPLAGLGAVAALVWWMAKRKRKG